MNATLDRDARQDIADLLVRYATGIDRRDWPLFRSCFTDDPLHPLGDRVATLPGADLAVVGLVSDYNADRLELARKFGAHVMVNPAERSPYEVWREVAQDRRATAPPVIFECVGAAGLLQSIVESCEPGSRIFAAGGWYTGDTVRCTDATHKGVTIQFGGGPHPVDWYGTLDAVCEGRLDPLPSVGMVIGLDEVPEAIDLARRAKGPPRIIIHP